VSFISFRKTRAQRGVQDGLIHCCAEHSQYDPARGAEVLSGPARQPLCAVLLRTTRRRTPDRLRTLGGELFEEFFRKYEMKLSSRPARRRGTW
jgi:arsenite oxidase small subunit